MAVWSEVKFSKLEHFRIDAEFYQPKYLRAHVVAGNKRLKHFNVDVIHPTEVKRIYSDEGLRIMLAQNNRDNYYDWSVERYMPVKMKYVLATNKLNYGDVTVTRSGANFGQTSVITFEAVEPEVFACADLLIVKTQQISGALLSTYLNSKVGKLLMERGVYGAGQPHVAPTYVKEIPFPEKLLTYSSEIDELIFKSRNKADMSKTLYTQAQDLLDKELGLKAQSLEKPIGYLSSLSKVESSRRFDSEHFYPSFDKFIENLPKSIKLKSLGSLLNFCQRGRQPLYTNDGLPVLNSKHIKTNRIISKDNRRATTNSISAPIISHGDVLINGTGRGTIGRAAPYLIEDSDAIPDNHVTILRAKALSPSFLSFYLNSLAGQMQVEKHQRGSSGQVELYPEDIKKFLVWDAPQPIQDEIERLHLKALACEEESTLLLEQAKRRVEDLIEGYA